MVNIPNLGKIDAGQKKKMFRIGFNVNVAEPIFF